MQNLYIIKLGGSAITEKEQNKIEAKTKVIARIALEIKLAINEKKFSLIVVHGAGPFGHSNVKNFGINDGIFSEKQKKGLEKTINDCNKLNGVVVEKLKEVGINAESFDPCKLIVQKNKKIIEFIVSKIEKALEEKKVPVLFGQMVPDKKLNASVVSGDTIIGFLAKKFKPEKIFLGTDVKGIFSGDPKSNENAVLVGEINKNNFNEIIENVGGAKTVDVTEGMKGKLLKLKEQLLNQEAFIFDMTKKENAFKALTGRKVEGTKIRF